MIISGEQNINGMSVTELNKISKNNTENLNTSSQNGSNDINNINNINNEKISQVSKQEKIDTEKNIKDNDNGYSLSLNQTERNENSIKLKENLDTFKDISVVKNKLSENNEIMKAFIDTKGFTATKVSELENKLGNINNKILSSEEFLINKYNQNNNDISNIVNNNSLFGKNNIFMDGENQSFLKDYQNVSKNNNLLEEPAIALNNMKNKVIEEIQSNLKSQKDIVDKNLSNNPSDYTRLQLPLIQTGYLAYTQSNTNQANVFNLLK